MHALYSSRPGTTAARCASRNVYVPVTWPNPANRPVLVRAEHVLADTTPDGQSPTTERRLRAAFRSSVPDTFVNPLGTVQE